VLLAVTAEAVALVSVIVTGLTAILGPLITWQIARSGQKHERDVDISRRNYEARREVYVEMLALSRVKVQALEAARDDTVAQPTWPDAEERRTLHARVTAFGSSDVADALYDFDLLWEKLWLLMESVPLERRKTVPLHELKKLQKKLGDIVKDEMTR
jgi:hypothetical protein